MVNLLFVILAAIPTIESPVTDPSGYLSGAAKEVIATELRAIRAETGVQMAVLVVDSTKPMGIDDYAQQVFERWGGGSTERDDGVLLVLAINDRRNRLHLGYGIEPFIPDSVARALLDNQVTYLRMEAYDRAIRGIVDGVATRVASIEPGAPIAVPLGMHHPGAFALVLMLGLIAGFLWAYQAVPKRLLDFDDLPYGHCPPHRGWALALWVAAPLCVGLLFISGKGFWYAYPLVWLAAAGFGAALVYAARQVSEPVAFAWGFLSPVGVFAVFIHVPTPVTNGGGVMTLLVYIVLALGAMLLLAGFFRLLASAQGTGGGWSGTSGGSTGWGGSGGSSSGWGSSGGGFSGGGGWGGGGGSSGGGGASSGW